MALFLTLLSLLKKLMSKELSSFSTLGFNNFLFCILFLMSGSVSTGKLRDAFWSTLLFQIVLLIPLLVTFSVDTQRRLPLQRVATWPLTGAQRLFLSAASFAFNPIFIVLFLGLLAWMGLAVALFFVSLGLIVHAAVYAADRLAFGFRMPAALSIASEPWQLGGIVQHMLQEQIATLDFWTALLLAVAGTMYRLFARPPRPEAFPIIALFVGIAMSTIAQRMLRLDEGRALLRYRLLPIAGWKLLVAQDMTFLILLAAMVSLLSLRTGLAFGLVAIAVGRYPSLRQPVSQRRWRFVGGDPRFGVAQVLLGGAAGIGAARVGFSPLFAAFTLYVGSVLWGAFLWKHAKTYRQATP